MRTGWLLRFDDVNSSCFTYLSHQKSFHMRVVTNDKTMIMKSLVLVLCVTFHNIGFAVWQNTELSSFHQPPFLNLIKLKLSNSCKMLSLFSLLHTLRHWRWRCLHLGRWRHICWRSLAQINRLLIQAKHSCGKCWIKMMTTLILLGFKSQKLFLFHRTQTCTREDKIRLPQQGVYAASDCPRPH